MQKELPNLTHLLFVDDILLFPNGDIKCIRRIVELLDKYGKGLRQVVNMEKTKMFLGRRSFSRKVMIAEESNMKLANLPVKYLGVTLISGRITREAVANVVDTIKNTQCNSKADSFPSQQGWN